MVYFYLEEKSSLGSMGLEIEKAPRPPTPLIERIIADYPVSIIFGALTIGSLLFALFVRKKFKSKKEPKYIQATSIAFLVIAILPPTIFISLGLLDIIIEFFAPRPLPQSLPGGRGNN